MFQIEAPAKFGQRVFGKEFGGTSMPREIHAVAFAPFSQNSARLGIAGLL